MYIVREGMFIIIFLFILIIIVLAYCFRKKTGVKFTVISVVVILAVFCLYWAQPVKYAVKEEEFGDYTHFLLIREVHYTGTGWAIVGDSSGYFQESQIIDVVLTGEKLPEAEEPADYYNTFLCIVNDLGLVEHAAFQEKINSYEIIDWYPVYPVKRNRLMPCMFYPQGYMTSHDVELY